MAMTFDAESAHAGSRPTGAGIVVVADRSESFRQARRHSRMVRILRFSLPLVGVLLIVGFVGADGHGLAAFGGQDGGVRVVHDEAHDNRAGVPALGQ